MKARRWSNGRLFAACVALLAGSAMVLAACGGGTSDKDKTSTAAAKSPATTASSGTSTSGGTIPANVGKDDKAQLTGAGATFPNPLYTRWFADYNKNVAPGVQVNYQAIGSGGGVKQITEKTVDFGASDAPMTDAELSKAEGIVHIPTTMGAVTITYNLDGVTTPLKFDGNTLAKIYLGQVTNWNDPAIAALNAGVSLPDAEIVVVHRSDGSGTSFVFTDYLTKSSPDWDSKVGTSKNPDWPVGLGGQGNDGVTQQVKQNKNSIGYVELTYAKTNNLPISDIKHQDGTFITPSPESTSLAAQGVSLPADYRTSVTNSPTAGAYPISSFTYILLYKDQTNASKGTALVHMLWWAIHDGQKTTTELYYAPLPPDVVKSVEVTLRGITANGQPILTGS